MAAFFRTHYVPNNAILCVAGDFSPLQAKQWIEKYFGPVSRGPEVKPPNRSVPSLSAEKHIRSTDAVSLPRAQLIWPTVPANHPDEPALDVLAAVLGGLPKENRLFRALVYDRQLAAAVDASHPTQSLAGTFEVELYARPGEKLDEIVKIADAEIERLKNEGATPLEVKKAQNERESALIMGLQSVTRKATVLNQSMEIVRRSARLSDRAGKGLRRDSGGRDASGQAIPRSEADRAGYPARRARIASCRSGCRSVEAGTPGESRNSRK